MQTIFKEKIMILHKHIQNDKQLVVLFKIAEPVGFAVLADSFMLYKVVFETTDNSYPVFEKAKIGSLLDIEALFVPGAPYTLDGTELIVNR